MVSEELTAYAPWSMTRRVLPAHSRLYHLLPIGVGTADVEGLSSYSARLAAAHGVPVRTLVTRELVPLLGRRHLAHPVNNSLSSFWITGSPALQGGGTLARDWVQVLETLTLRQDLRFLTLLTWADVLPEMRLLRRVRAWCPACYEDWRVRGQVIYDPLLWALTVVTLCPRHARPLVVQCPHPGCQKRLPPLASRAQPGYCSQCAQWLGLPPIPEPAAANAVAVPERAWHLWVAQAVGTLLTTAPTLAGPPRRDAATAALAAGITQAGGAAASARALQVSLGTLCQWRQGTHLPHLSMLVRLCAYLGTSPARLLTARPAARDGLGSAPPLPPLTQGAPRPGHAPFPAERLRHTLEEIMGTAEWPPPSMREIARRTGYAHSQLHHRFPDLCRAISARYLTYRTTSATAKRQRLCAEVRQATHFLHGQGVYPSTPRVARLLPTPGSLRHPDANAAWHAALRELGWEV